MGEEAPRGRRAKRPEAHYLGLDEIEHLLETAWQLARADRTAYQNALRTEVAIFTGLRAMEVMALRPVDLRLDGTVLVRMQPHLKGAKPRVAAFVNGQAESPTLAVLRRHVQDLGPRAAIWSSGYAAWARWVVRRLGPASGLQERITPLNGNEGVARYRVHVHAFRAAFVVLCRRAPRRAGVAPVPWEAIAQLGGWESVDTIKRHYYYADLDEALAELRRALPLATIATPARPAPAWGHGEAYL